ncbi:signal transduction histidine kinase [Marmoricola sp. URHA0025 HA25]
MIAVADLRRLSLFDGVSDDHLADLARAGEEVAFERGTLLFTEGEHADSWWVLVDGAVDLVRRVGREDVVVRTMNVPGLWAGGFRAWDEHGVYLATGRGAAEGRLLRVPAPALRELATAWFPLGVHLIEGVYGTARSIESTVRQRESLVALGTLAAGLAHELNNPAAAATRAVDTLQDASGYLLSSLRQLADKDITAQQFAALDALRLELQPQPPTRSALDVADAEDAVATWLEDREVEDAWQMAPALVSGGADPAWCEKVEAALGAEALRAGVSWVASAVSVELFLAELKESTQRISNLVATVKSYSQMDRASRQRVDVTEGIESTLVVLGRKLRDGVTVVREYDAGVPEIEVYAGELNQVWTNLIDNALDAMEDAGTLRLSTRSEDGAVVVEVADTGGGMPPEVVTRAFEAFYTTKDVGKGTGLGLDIARRIVEERHGGSISVDTGPDGTTMTVRLPIDA